MTTDTSFVATPRGDLAQKKREQARRRVQWTIQALVVFLVVVCFGLLANNVAQNLSERNIRSGFAFLMGSSGFDIGEALIPFDSLQAMWIGFANGLLNTIRVSVISIITAMVLGTVVGLMRLSHHPVLRFLGTAHVECYRNIPLIILLFAIYMVVTELLPMSSSPLALGNWLLLSKAGLQFAVPNQSTLALMSALIIGILVCLLGRAVWARRMTDLVATLSGMGLGVVAGLIIWVLFGFISGWSKPEIVGLAIEGGTSLSPEFLALWLGLTMFTSAAIAEIVRAGVLAVPKGQWMAGQALGLTRIQTISYVIFPQSMRLAIPPLTSQFMNLTKNSSLAVVIGYPDIVAVGNSAINVTGQALEIIFIIMMVYLFLNLVIAILMNAINSRVMSAQR